MIQGRTIYLNHAGTSWPKPEPVIKAAASLFSLNPREWEAEFETAHQTVADFFHVDRSRLLLTPSCTAAIGLGVLDQAWRPGDRIVTSHHEHHAVYRTILKLKEQGIEASVLPSSDHEPIDLNVLEAELKAGRVRLLALTAANNVTGQLLPIAESIELAHAFGAIVLIDGAQVAGWWDLDLLQLGADLFTFAGHKGPQAPWGIGGLYVSPDVLMKSPAAVCEGPVFDTSSQCTVMPGYCDAGSVNLSALMGLAEACRWLSDPKRSTRLEHARGLAQEFTAAVRQLPSATVHGDASIEHKVPTVALTLADRLVSDVANQLREQGVIASSGYQCAPQAHAALGTSLNGVIRFSFGPGTKASEVEEAVDSLKRVDCETS